MAFVKELKLTALDSEVYNTVTWEDISDTWDATSTRYTDTTYNNTYSNGWTIEKYYGINTFESIGGDTDDDIFVETDDLTWDSLTDYIWGTVIVPRVNQTWAGETTAWGSIWQKWYPDFDGLIWDDDGDTWSAESAIWLEVFNTPRTTVLTTLDGEWDDTRQVDKFDTIINSQFLKYSWAANDSTWDSLT
jgi:hypothetical protein